MGSYRQNILLVSSSHFPWHNQIVQAPNGVRHTGVAPITQILFLHETAEKNSQVTAAHLKKQLLK